MFREAIIAVTKAADWYALHPLTAGQIRGLFQLNLANRRNDIVRIPCSFTKQGGEIRAYFAGVYAMEEVR